jgi:hypothetical protein
VSEQIVIERRFRGPPKSANGGYVCGLLAGFLGRTAEVTLRRPPPIGRPLILEHDGGGATLRDGDILIAEGAPATIELDVPPPVSFDDATLAAKSCVWLKANVPYPTCFVCGEQRAAGDGLRIFAGAVAGRDIVAAPWTPDASLGGENGAVRPEFVWSALDCPGAFAFIESADDMMLLGRLAARLIKPVEVSQRYVVIGWRMGGEGRKIYTGTALYSHTGTLCAVARATWFKIDTPEPSKTP